jgi:hypothetical protein
LQGPELSLVAVPSIMTDLRNNDAQRVLAAMRSGEWLRTQWIVRVAFDLGTSPWEVEYAMRVKAVLRKLERWGFIERREVTATRSGEVGGQSIAFSIPRGEWRLKANAWPPASDFDSG